MSRQKRDTKRLMHWCKNGDLVFKNKIKDAILRENLYEERSLDSTLSSLSKYQNQEQRQLVNKRLQFAKRRQRSLEKSELHNNFLEKRRSFSDGALPLKGDQTSHRKIFDAKLKWQKAISVVRFAVQSKSGKKTKRSRQTAANVLPSIIQANPKSSPKPPRKNTANDNHLVLPRIGSGTIESKNCLEDPRFLRLQQILSLGEDKNTETSERSPKNTNREWNGHGGPAGRLRSQTFHL